MAKPTIIPEWDANEVNSIEPDQDHKDDGWLAPGGVPEKPPFQTFNHWQNNVYKWITYFDENLTKQIQAIGASVSANALTITFDPADLDFRSASLPSGAINTRTILSPISLVISSGSTLGTISNVQSRIAVLAIDDGSGGFELAVVNLAGGVNLDETTLISTSAEGGIGGADTADTIYSGTARSNVPFRVIGYIESAQTTAGTWAAAPSTVQGAGGLAMDGLNDSGQWVDVSGSRSISATYYNTTGRVLRVSVSATSGQPSRLSVAITQNGNTNTLEGTGVAAGDRLSIYFDVPPGASYVLVNVSGTPTLQSWFEF